MGTNRYLHRDAFRQFLVDAGDEVVGISRHDRQCPISTHLEDITKRNWNISPLNCVPQVNARPGEDQFRLEHEFKPPRWARDFIYALDRQYPDRQPLTGNQTLYVLDEAVA